MDKTGNLKLTHLNGMQPLSVLLIAPVLFLLTCCTQVQQVVHKLYTSCTQVQQVQQVHEKVIQLQQQEYF